LNIFSENYLGRVRFKDSCIVVRKSSKTKRVLTEEILPTNNLHIDIMIRTQFLLKFELNRPIYDDYSDVSMIYIMNHIHY